MQYYGGFNKKKIGTFDHSQHGIKRNKELDDFIDKLCEIMELREHKLLPTCTHPPAHFVYRPDRILEEVGLIKDERDRLRKEIDNLKIEFDERITKLEKEKNTKIEELEQTVLKLINIK